MLDASVEEMRDHEQENWHGQWNSQKNTLRHQPMAKVLVPMKPPETTEKSASCRSWSTGSPSVRKTTR